MTLEGGLYTAVRPIRRRENGSLGEPDGERNARMSEENEQRVRTFYGAILPGHRERVTSLQAAHVVYELPDGMPTGGGRFEGVDVREEFLPGFYGAFDAHFATE